MLRVVIDFLLKMMAAWKKKLKENWIPCKRQIGKKGVEITPLNLIRRNKLEAKDEDLDVGTDLGEDANNWISIFLVGVYRLSKTSDDGYKRTLSEYVLKAMERKGYTDATSLRLEI